MTIDFQCGDDPKIKTEFEKLSPWKQYIHRELGWGCNPVRHPSPDDWIKQCAICGKTYDLTL